MFNSFKNIYNKKVFGYKVFGKELIAVPYWADAVQFFDGSTVTKEDGFTYWKDRTENEYDAKLVSSNCLDVGLATIIAFGSLSGVTISSFEGEAVPLIVGSTITFTTSGSFYNVVLSNGSHYPCSEGEGTTLYDVNSSTRNDATITNEGFTTQSTYHYSLLNGFDYWVNDSNDNILRVPFNNNLISILTSTDTITGYTWASRNKPWKWHNNAETKLINDVSYTNLITADTTQQYWYNAGVPQEVGYANLNYEVYDDGVLYGHTFSDISTENRRTNIVSYATEKTPQEKADILKFVNGNELLLDSNSLPLLTDAGEPLYVRKV